MSEQWKQRPIEIRKKQRQADAVFLLPFSREKDRKRKRSGFRRIENQSKDSLVHSLWSYYKP